MKVTEPEDAQQYSALFDATIRQAVGGAPALMARLVAHVRGALRELESDATNRRERDRLTHARRLLTHAFASEIVNRITVEPVREHLEQVLWARLEELIEKK